jgi:hypothetical protein
MLVGKTCQIDTQARRRVGGDYGFGKTKAFGSIYGANSCQCLMKMDCWIGKKPLLMAALHRQKKGRLRWKDQKR